MLKKNVDELKKQMERSNIFLLPVKASEVLRQWDTMASMSTTVQLAFVLMREKNSLHQDFLNRSLSFILKDTPDNILSRKADIEKALTQITGGHVNVYEVHEAHEGRGSLVHAWILYPSEGTVDLRDLQRAAATILHLDDDIDETTAGHDTSREKRGQKDSDRDSIHTASVIHFEYQALFWILFFFIVLTLVFLFILCCIWCWFCRSPAQFKEWRDGTQRQTLPVSPAAGSAPVLVLSDRQSLIQQKQANGRKSGLVHNSSLDSDEVERGSDGYANQAFKYHDKVKKIRPPRQTRVRLKQGLSRSITTMNTNDMVYPEDSDRRTSKPKSMDSSFDEEEDGDDESGVTGDRGKGRRTEIMYIRSPPDSYDENFRTVSENEVTYGRGDGTEDAIFTDTYMRRSSTKQVSFRMQGLHSRDPSQELVRDTHDMGISRRSSSNETIASVVDLNPHPEDLAFESVPEPSQNRDSRTPASVSSGESRAGKYVTAISLPGTVDDRDDDSPHIPTDVNSPDFAGAGDAKVPDETNKSDSDSGIGRGSKTYPPTDLNIKNKSLMERKDVFAIAYDGIHTQRIRSAESDRESL